MKPPATMSCLALRAAWTWRLLRGRFRQRRFAMAIASLAFGMTAAAVLAGAAMWPAGESAGRSSLSGEGAALVAFLRDDLPLSARDGLSAALGRLPGVARVRLLGSDEALARMRRELGDRASVLDGVEDGFLPATLEITLNADGEGADRADAIAWRLRRMEGITDVDVLRTVADERLARAQVDSRSSRRLVVVLACATAALGLCLAALAMRTWRGDATLLTGLGFTAAAAALPGALTGGICAALGATVGFVLNAVFSHRSWGHAASVPVGERWTVAGVMVFLLLGMTVGWWGTRPSGRDSRELGPHG